MLACRVSFYTFVCIPAWHYIGYLPGCKHSVRSSRVVVPWFSGIDCLSISSKTCAPLHFPQTSGGGRHYDVPVLVSRHFAHADWWQAGQRHGSCLVRSSFNHACPSMRSSAQVFRSPIGQFSFRIYFVRSVANGRRIALK